MKFFLMFAAFLFVVSGYAQPIKSDVYSWKNLPVSKKESSENRQIVDGTGATLDNIEVHATTLNPKSGPQPKNTHQEEVMLTIKEGKLKVTIGNQSKILGPGSLAFAISGDAISVENMADTKTTYYVFKFKSKGAPDVQRAKDAGGSFFIDWNDLKYNTHDRGGVRQYFTRPTATLKRFDIHVTTLNAGIKSHEPHTHKVEEIVLMIEGEGEMQIADATKKATTGDLIYLESNVSHAIKNADTKPIMYWAIQWE